MREDTRFGFGVLIVGWGTTIGRLSLRGTLQRTTTNATLVPVLPNAVDSCPNHHKLLAFRVRLAFTTVVWIDF